MKNLQNELLRLFGDRVSHYGFVQKPREQYFYKKVPLGRVVFHLAFIKHKADFDVTADVAVRFDELEDLVNIDNKLITKKEKAETYSLGVEVGNLTAGSQMRWSIFSEADLSATTEALLSVFVDVALPYFEKYANLESAFEVLSRNDAVGRLHSPFNSKRAKRALGLAVLLGYSDLIPKLIDEAVTFMKEGGDSGVSDYLDFAKRFA